MLKKLATVNPNARWWIKGDGTDVVKGLWESVSGEWSGDIDLNDGKLSQLYKEFQNRLAWVKCIGIGNIATEKIKEHAVNKGFRGQLSKLGICNFWCITGTLLSACILCILIINQMCQHLVLFYTKLQAANQSYQEHLSAGHTSEQSMFSIS